jgi:O-antigen biosynthesis protein
MQTVLVIGFVWPEPNSSAAGSHLISIMRAYKQQGWRVCFATPAQDSAHKADLAQEGIESQAIALNCDSVEAFLQTLQPNMVHFDRFMMEEQFGWRVDKVLPQALKVLETCDLQLLREGRHHALKQNRALTLEDLQSDLAKREVAAILRCDIALIISTFEMQLLENTFKLPSHILHHVPFMVNPDNLSQQTNSQPDFHARQHFVAIGNFRHAPNWDSVLFLQTLWPAIRQQLPQAELHIYGAYPPPKATALHNPKTGFLVKGWADNALTVMQHARVCLAPLRFGAGLKGKLLDAMLTQTPSVTTPIGAEGMQLDDLPWPGAVTETEQDFVEAAVALYSKSDRWQQAQARTFPYVSQQFNGAEIAPRFINKLNAVMQNLAEHRQQNFMGAILKHHTLASTKYMSQWIMEKNKAK